MSSLLVDLCFVCYSVIFLTNSLLLLFMLLKTLDVLDRFTYSKCAVGARPAWGIYSMMS